MERKTKENRTKSKMYTQEKEQCTLKKEKRREGCANQLNGEKSKRRVELHRRCALQDYYNVHKRERRRREGNAN